jgi:hypothetical protein
MEQSQKVIRARQNKINLQEGNLELLLLCYQ